MKKIVLLVIIFFTLLLVGCSGTGTSTNDQFYTVPISSMTTTELLNRIDFCLLLVWDGQPLFGGVQW
jgi:uncharacterized lipoprotein YmbA